MKEIVVVFTFLLLTFTAQAQDSTLYLKCVEDKDYVQAYVIDNAGNEITGIMRNAPSHSKVVLITKTGKQVYLPKDLRSYNLDFKNYVSDGKSFYKIVYEGKVSLYEKIVLKETITSYAPPGYPGSPGVLPGGGTGMPTVTGEREITTQYFCKNGSMEFKAINKGKFKTEFSKYFADCEILKSKIKNGDLTIKDLDLIRYIYNNDCKE